MNDWPGNRKKHQMTDRENDGMAVPLPSPMAAALASRPELPPLRLGDQQVDGVMFVPARPDPIRTIRPHRLHITGRADILHVSTDDGTRLAHIRRSLIQRIAEAKTKVLFCSFLFADEEIVSALCEASERLHGGVYVLTALGKHLHAEVLELDVDLDANALKLQERGKRHEEQLKRLARAGAWVRSAEDCHAKFCVVDDECAIVTSANATQEAYESNPEDGLVLHDPRVAHEFGRLFAQIWQHMTTLESTPGSYLDVHTRPSLHAPPWRVLSAAGVVRPVTTLRQAEVSLREAAIEVIDRAQDHLAIASYSFMGMESHPVGAALARAVARGARIDLLVQPRNHIDAQRASLAWLARLAPDRVHLHGHRRTHTKSIVADNQVVLLWTGNLDARHGWEDGIEVGVVVEDVGVASAVARWTADVMDRSTHTALIGPSARQLVEAGQATALPGEWNLRLPAGVSGTTVIAALSRNAVELVDTPGGLVLRCANEMLLDLRVDETGRRLDVTRIRQVEGLVGSRTKGWLSNSVIRVVTGSSVPLSHGFSSQPPQRGRKGKKR